MTEQPFSPTPTQDDKLWAALSYPISFIVPILALVLDDKKVRPFIKYHATQALILHVILAVVYTITGVTVIGLICWPILWLLTLWPAWEAYQGKELELPVITDFARNQGWI